MDCPVPRTPWTTRLLVAATMALALVCLLLVLTREAKPEHAAYLVHTQEPHVQFSEHYAAAFAATQAREHSRAAEEWKRARAAGGDDAECLRNAAEAAFHARDLPGAESAARELLTLVPRSWAGHYTLAVVAERRKDVVTAARFYRLAAQYATDDDERRLASRRLTRTAQ